MADTTLHLQLCLERLQAGEESARQELLNTACERLTRPTRKMFRHDGRLRRWEETCDIFQNAMIRLCRALTDVTPGSLREFYRLAALQIRRELVDLARHYYGPAGPGLRHDSRAGGEEGEGQETTVAADSSFEPSRLAAWSEFHQKINDLPDEQREIFDLVYYQTLTHDQAAALLQVSTKTIQRRWQKACLLLHDKMQGHLPGR